MKIGIVTLPLNYNYGGLLQAYALQTVLERLGNEVEILNLPYRPHQIQNSRKPIIYTKRLIRKYLLGERYLRICSENYYNKTYSIVCQNTNKFIEKYLHCRRIESFSEIEEHDYDCYVVGSDQIWRYAFMPNITDAYLEFAKGWNVKRLSYAASLGVDFWEYNPQKTLICSYLIKLFDAVSVREKSGVSLLRENMKIEATHVLDPTMLLTKDDYKGLMKSNSEIITKNNMMVYILDYNKDKEEAIDYLTNIQSVTPIYYNSKIESVDTDLTLEERIQPSVENWLLGFAESKLIVTDSFHACVFSILFHKSFYVLSNKKRGLSRIESLLDMFCLSERLVSSLEEIKSIPSNIDYSRIDKILADKRIESYLFLQNSLKI